MERKAVNPWPWSLTLVTIKLSLLKVLTDSWFVRDKPRLMPMATHNTPVICVPK
jgi:hypothetical protein